jgi:hypothetical protein
MALTNAERQRRYRARLQSFRDDGTIPVEEHDAEVAALKSRVEALRAQRDKFLACAQAAYLQGAEEDARRLENRAGSAVSCVAIRDEAMQRLRLLPSMTLDDLLDLAKQAGAAQFRRFVNGSVKQLREGDAQ